MKEKDAYWFRHDSNAKDDPKIMLLIDQLGLEGYGIFWVLVELLRDQPEYKYPLKLLPTIARRYNTSAEKMLTVVQKYELFEIEHDEFFFSSSLRDRMAALDARRELAKKAGIASGKSRKVLPEGKRTDVQRPFNDRSTTVERIDKKREEKNIKEQKPNYFKILD